MARDGSGNYNLPVNSWNPATNGSPATAADWQALVNDLASAVGQSVSKDGQTAMTGNLPMGNNKVTGMQAGTASTDGVNKDQLNTLDSTGVSAFAKTLLDDVDAAAMLATLGVLQAVYPVGSIYTNATNNTNPGTLLGFGTWTAFGAGRVPVGFDSGDSLFNAAEKTGGSKDAIVVSHTHTGTTSTIGDHVHAMDGGYLKNNASGGGIASGSGVGAGTETNPAGFHNHTFTTDSTGASGTNANVQPYITVYMWKRTA